jgi:hypothetical protein
MRASRVVHGEPILVLVVQLVESPRLPGSRKPVGKELFLISSKCPFNYCIFIGTSFVYEVMWQLEELECPLKLSLELKSIVCLHK